MDPVNTIIKIWTSLSNAPIDWSMDGGMIWLTGMSIIVAIYVTLMITVESRRQNRREIYARAEHAANLRRRYMSERGYIEIINR